MKRKRHYKAKRGNGGQISQTVGLHNIERAERRAKARKAAKQGANEEADDFLDRLVTNPLNFLIYTAVLLAAAFLSKWLF